MFPLFPQNVRGSVCLIARRELVGQTNTLQSVPFFAMAKLATKLRDALGNRSLTCDVSWRLVEDLKHVGHTRIPLRHGRSGIAASHRMLHGRRALNTPRGVENLQANHLAVCVVVEDDAGFFFIALLDDRIAEDDAKDVHLSIISHFHGVLQYLLIFVVLYTVTTSGGSTSNATIARTRNSRLPNLFFD